MVAAGALISIDLKIRIWKGIRNDIHVSIIEKAITLKIISFMNLIRKLLNYGTWVDGWLVNMGYANKLIW